jgi:hypothetical protein
MISTTNSSAIIIPLNAVMSRKDESLRRRRLGDIKTLLRHRCGPELPDDDAGREYLYELLPPVSLGPEPVLKIANVIEVWAPWMNAQERFDLVAYIERTPVYMRKITAVAEGERLRLTNAERRTYGIRTIAAYDVTEEQRLAERQNRKRARDERYRRRDGKRPRAEYGAVGRSKPWEAVGISRATWYRQRETSQRRIKLLNTERLLVSRSKRVGREGVADKGGHGDRRSKKPNIMASGNSESKHEPMALSMVRRR